MNAAQKNVYDFNMERFKAFKAQDSETGNFDVVFEINGKKVFAHRCMLSLISTTFNSMLSDRWTNPGEPIKLEEYTFEVFTQLLTFIYSGECELKNDNIFAMIDIAEFYGIKALKEECETHLSGMLNAENVYQIVELVEKYSLNGLTKSLNSFISDNLVMFCKSNQFQYLQKSVVQDLVKANQHSPWQEELFEAVYKWSENQASEKQKLDQSLDLEKIIKDELSEFLPLIKFEKMEHYFLIEYVVRKSFFFSNDQLKSILWSRNKVFVKVIGKNGKVLKGAIQCDDVETVERFTNDFQSTKNQSCVHYNDDYCTWIAQQIPKLSTPSKLIKNDKIEWYLVYNKDVGVTVVRRKKLLESDYLFAEMSAENGFELSYDSKIEICSCF